MYMKNKTLISVIIPSYNRADTVGQTIDSILAQKVDADIEIVIGDDCSTDNAREVLEQYRQKYPDIIRLFLREQNMGLGANWAQCVKDCQGEFICNCDNDDYWHNPNKLQLQLDYMRAHPESNICITDYRTFNHTTGEITEKYSYIADTNDLQTFMWSNHTYGNITFMYRADFMKTHLDLDEFINRRFSLQDWPVWVILTAYSNIDIIHVSTATVRVGETSISRPDSLEKYAKRLLEDGKIARYLGELFPEKFPYSDKMWDDYMNISLMNMGFRVGDYESAAKYGKSVSGSLKQICSQNRVLFYLFRLAKRLYQE